MIMCNSLKFQRGESLRRNRRFNRFRSRLTGRHSGSAIGMADVNLLVRSESTARIEEVHPLLFHILCGTSDSVARIASAAARVRV